MCFTYVHKVQRKVRLNWLGPSKEIIKKELPSISLRFFEKYFPVSVGIHLASSACDGGCTLYTVQYINSVNIFSSTDKCDGVYTDTNSVIILS